MQRLPESDALARIDSVQPAAGGAVHGRRRQQPHARRVGRRRAHRPEHLHARRRRRLRQRRRRQLPRGAALGRSCRCRPRASRSSARPAPTPTPRSAAAAARSSSSSPSAAPTGSVDRPTGIARTTRSTRTAGTARGSASRSRRSRTTARASRSAGRSCANKTFFFTNYEARRFPRTTQVSRTVPTDSLKAGILQFRDAAGNVVTYNLRALDPRGIGLNPVVVEPVGPAAGRQRPEPRRRVQHDRLHRGSRHLVQQRRGRAAARSQLLQQLARGRQLPVRQHPRDRRRAGRHRRAAVRQHQGRAGGHRRSAARAALRRRRASPASSRRGCSSTTRFSYVRGFLAFTRVSPFAQVPGTNVALDVGGTTLDEPLDVAIQQARSQVANAHNYQFVSNSTLTLDKHTLLFGGTWRREYWYFLRNEQLGGSLTSPVANINTGNFVTIPTNLRPATCSATQTTNCLVAADVNRFTQLYASMLGPGGQHQRAGDARHQPAAAAARHAAGSADHDRRLRVLPERHLAADAVVHPERRRQLPVPAGAAARSSTATPF